MMAAVWVVGNRTVTNLVRLIWLVNRCNPSTYHPVLSRRRSNTSRLSKVRIGFILDRNAPNVRISLRGDETVDRHRGNKGYAEARHRDAVRRSRSRKFDAKRHSQPHHLAGQILFDLFCLDQQPAPLLVV